jgi:hypothetical protein
MGIISRVMATAAAGILAGCASPTVTEIRAPDGTSLKNVKCNIDSQKCFLLASSSCRETNGSYQVVASHSNAGGSLADAMPGPFTWYHMTFSCGPSDGKIPSFPFKGQQYTPPTTIINNPVHPAQRSTTTNCTRIGDTVNCRTF